jgi:branched-chain amino acid transport system ATP-binding protein
MLSVKDIQVAYDETQVIFDVSLSVVPGEVLCLLGRNGAGKTTTLKAIMVLLPLRAGTISLNGENMGGMPAHEVPKQGIAYVPQGRRLFTEMSVAQNMEIGLMVSQAGNSTREKVLELFPRLRERLKQRAETLSGGEQQMLAMARALCTEPKVFLLDEPVEGLQPSMISLIRDVIIKMKQENVAIVLVEQQLDAVIAVADKVTFIEHGRSPETVSADELSNDDGARLQRYLGV